MTEPSSTLIGRYRDVFLQLLPPGPAITKAIGSHVYRLMKGIGTEFARVHQRALDLLEEADPSTADELLGEWETMVGLPDTCTAPTTDDDRRTLVKARLVGLGGHAPSDYEAVAEALLGDSFVSLEAEHFFPFTCVSACTDALYQDEWANVVEWVVTTTGAPLARLECEFNRRKRAHAYFLYEWWPALSSEILAFYVADDHPLGDVRQIEDRSSSGLDMDPIPSGPVPSVETGVFEGHQHFQIDIGEYAQATLAAPLAQPFTIAMRARVTDPGVTSTAAIFVGGGAVYLGCNASPAWEAGAGGSLITSPMIDDTAVVVAVFDGANSVLYVDDMAAGASGSLGTDPIDGTLLIGGYGAAGAIQVTQALIVDGALSLADRSVLAAYLEEA